MRVFKKWKRAEEARYELVTTVLVLATALLLWALIA